MSFHYTIQQVLCSHHLHSAISQPQLNVFSLTGSVSLIITFLFINSYIQETMSVNTSRLCSSVIYRPESLFTVYHENPACWINPLCASVGYTELLRELVLHQRINSVTFKHNGKYSHLKHLTQQAWPVLWPRGRFPPLLTGFHVNNSGEPP